MKTNPPAVLAKITSKNQLTLPKSVTEALGPVQYFEVQAQAGQIILTPVRIQRGDAVRAKLAELALDERSIAAALAWAEQAAQPPARKAAAKVSPTASAKVPGKRAKSTTPLATQPAAKPAVKRAAAPRRRAAR